MTDLTNLTARELEELSREALALAENKKAEERKALRASLVEQIHAAGYAVDEIFPGAAAVKGKPPEKARTAAKYQNPDNPAQTWAVRGRKPKWLVEKEAAGHSLAEFEIQEN